MYLGVDELVGGVVEDRREVGAHEDARLARLRHRHVLVVDEHVAAVLELDPVLVPVARRRALAARRWPCVVDWF